MDGYPKTAACACGALTVTVTAPPWRVHACFCLDCQRRTGSAFSYSAFFAEAQATVGGEARRFRRTADSGHVHDAHFCPACGCTVFSRLEGIPGSVAVPVGCFADPAFERPIKLYWAVRRHGWMKAPEGAQEIERQ
jgi:hypothetical protein